jgi:hypothetical protein
LSLAKRSDAGDPSSGPFAQVTPSGLLILCWGLGFQCMVEFDLAANCFGFSKLIIFRSDQSAKLRLCERLLIASRGRG